MRHKTALREQEGQVERAPIAERLVVWPWWLEALFIVGFMALVAWTWPDLRAWYTGMLPVQTSRLVDCRLPTEHETLLVTINLRTGQVVAGPCLYVGAPGTYRGAGR